MRGLGVVVIGRDEGARLVRCLDALAGAAAPVIYVDSASRDGSPEAARARGAEVVALDPARPLNAARARNEGYAALAARHPEVRWVQFVDGDTALAPGWLEAARRALEADPRRGVVAGHLAERDAGASVLHLLCALEWRRDPGPAEAVGGIFMARREAFEAAGGFDGGIPAGEEADLCQRVRARGYAVEHLDVPMGTHDAGPLGLRSWWLRSVRTGHAYARGAEAGRWRRELRSCRLWGLALPAAAALLAWPTGGLALLALLAWPLQAGRVALAARRRGWTWREAAWYGAFTVAGKLPEAQGTLRFARERRRGVAPRLVTYR